MNQTVNGWQHVSDFETITVSTSAIGLTDVKVQGNVPIANGFQKPSAAFITCALAAVRLRFDADPTSTSGHVLGAGEPLTLTNFWELENVKFILHGAECTDAALSVSYLR